MKKDFTLIIYKMVKKIVQPLYTSLSIPASKLGEVWQNYYSENENVIDKEFQDLNILALEARIVGLAKNIVIEYLDSIKSDNKKLLLAKSNIKNNKQSFLLILGRKKYSEIVA